MTTLNLMKSKQTKRKPNKKKNLKKLWDAFDSETMDTQQKLELHYSKSNISQRETCDLCNSSVAYTQNKLLTCTNPNCGVI